VKMHMKNTYKENSN